MRDKAGYDEYGHKLGVIAYRHGSYQEHNKKRVGGTIFKPLYNVTKPLYIKYIEVLLENGDSYFVYQDAKGFGLFKKHYMEYVKLNQSDQRGFINHEFFRNVAKVGKRSKGCVFSSDYRDDSNYVYSNINSYINQHLDLVIKAKDTNCIRKTSSDKHDLFNYVSSYGFDEYDGSFAWFGNYTYLQNIRDHISSWSDSMLIVNEETLKYRIHALQNKKLINVIGDLATNFSETYTQALLMIRDEQKRRGIGTYKQLNDESLHHLTEIQKQKLMPSSYNAQKEKDNIQPATHEKKPFQPEMRKEGPGHSTIRRRRHFPDSFERRRVKCDKPSNDSPNDWGKRGEDEVDYQLGWLNSDFFSIKKEIFEDNQKKIILHSPTLCRSQEFDHIVVSSSGVYVIETKNYKDKIKIQPNGNWIRIRDGKEEGEESPVAQIIRHHKIISSILRDIVNDEDIHDIICIANSSAIIEGDTNCTIPIVKYDVLVEYLENIHRSYSGDHYDADTIIQLIEKNKIKR